MIYHVLNRGNGRRDLFTKPADFDAFVKLLAEALGRFEVELLAYCLMGNHWHLLLRPRTAAALSRMMAWLTVTHARRHHKHYPHPGSGHLYQGRFKSFPVESDEHFLIVARYIHANPLRARLVKRAQDWRWSDLGNGGVEMRWRAGRCHGSGNGPAGESGDAAAAVCSGAAEHSPRFAVGIGAMGASHGREIGPGEHAAAPRPAAQTHRIPFAPISQSAEAE